MTSPIEMMIDKACGATGPSVQDRAAEALVTVGDAAVAWLRAKEMNTLTEKHEVDLEEAADRLARLGW